MRIKSEETLDSMVGGVERHSLPQYVLYCSNNQTRLNNVSRVLRNFVIYVGHQTSRSVIPNRGSAVPWGTANTS